MIVFTKNRERLQEGDVGRAWFQGRSCFDAYRITVGEDKAYDTSDHIPALGWMNVTPHVAQNDSLTKTGKRRRSAIDARTTRHIGYQISQTCRKMAECIFGWGKQHGTMRKTKHRGTAAVAAHFMLNLIAYNLVRFPKLTAA